MQQILELLPIALFFWAYSMSGETINVVGYTLTFDGIYTATAFLMIASVLHLGGTWLFTRKVERRLALLVLVIVVTGGLTLALRDNIFILWKPTLFNWALAAVFAGSHFVGSKKPLIERMLGSQLQLPLAIWQRLSKIWIGYFIMVGAMNLVVAYQFSEAFWVSYKLYSAIGFTLLISIATAVVVSPYLKESETSK
ncbi:putative intracellular septation protein A [BD1-7 clade bacterium]|uniref:Inner membrane-spanning protein YciB n=1 Tax=BD1-7 clade bacterium TaxID=2029982 RepID=A0A5S9QME6_9GAMM|nr:putative intracellular septation protein A [BD1-7 clade bacterium]